MPSTVKTAFHALALNDRRGFFRPTRVEGAREVWFPGRHSDVGGGGREDLSNISFRWMLGKAAEAGLPVTDDDGEQSRAEETAAELDWRHNHHRWPMIRKTDLIHRSVLEYGGDQVEKIAQLGVEESIPLGQS